MNDEEIVRLFMERDEAAIRYTKEKYGQRLTRLAYDITRHAQAAEECETPINLRGIP